MKINVGSSTLDNLSNLSGQLRDLELEHVANGDGHAADARDEVMDALAQYKSSRYRFGQALATYKAFFSEGRGWMEAAALIGTVIGRDERTIRRIVADFERASLVPAEAIRELEALGVDPAAKKNAATVTHILAMPTREVESKPKEAVAQAIEAAKAEKTGRAAKKPNHAVSAVGAIECAPLSRDEKQRRDIRQRIRSALTNVANDKKFAELVAALEEEMYEVWGERAETQLVLIPRPSALALDGRRKLECAA